MTRYWVFNPDTCKLDRCDHETAMKCDPKTSFVVYSEDEVTEVKDESDDYSIITEA